MDREEFYGIVDGNKKQLSGAASQSATGLSARLSVLSDDLLVAFANRFNEELVTLNKWDVWAAGYVAAGGMSDDAFHYFRSWLIGKGQQAVDSVKQDADSLADYLDGSNLDNEELEYAAIELMESRGILETYEAQIDADADEAPEGEPFDEDSVAQDYPRTAGARA